MDCYSLNLPPATAKPKSPVNSAVVSLTPSSSSSQLSFSSSSYQSIPLSISYKETISCRGNNRRASPVVQVMASNVDKFEPIKVMISGAPASGKGTQCELITKKFGLVHTAAGDLLREEIASGSENGRRAKEYMEKGQLVPNEIVVNMVKDRLLKPDSQQNGWLLDGFPRSLSQATALKAFGFHPDLFILLEVPEDILVERVVGRRLDPVTGKIYHMKYSPPENDEIAARLTQRFDDTEAKVKLRLQTHNENVKSVLSMYEDIIFKVDGSVPMKDVFENIDNALTKLIEQKEVSRNTIIAT